MTFGPSFDHNLCFRCLNGSCKPILDIYVPRAFQWYKKLFKPSSLTPIITFWRFGNPPKLHLPKKEFTWECEGSFPHTLLHFREHAVWLLGFLLAHNLTSSFALVASPRLGLRQSPFIHVPSSSIKLFKKFQ